MNQQASLLIISGIIIISSIGFLGINFWIVDNYDVFPLFITLPFVAVVLIVIGLYLK